MDKEYIVTEAGVDADDVPFVNILGKYSDIEEAREKFAYVFARELGYEPYKDNNLEEFKNGHVYAHAIRTGKYWTYNPPYILRIIKR